MLTPELIKQIAPRARDDYVKSLTSDAGWLTLARYDVTDKLERLAGFLANCMHETGGLAHLRESLYYPTPQRPRRSHISNARCSPTPSCRLRHCKARSVSSRLPARGRRSSLWATRS